MESQSDSTPQTTEEQSLPADNPSQQKSDSERARRKKMRKHGQNSSGDPQTRIGKLETQLREKEQLVSALTDRLEQAAEQLDRIRRTGGDRGQLVAGGGLPPELIEQQQELAEELKRAVEQWENMQAGLVLGRIEVQVTELRDLITSGGFSVPDSGHSAVPRHEPANKRKADVPSKPSGGMSASGWEALKAGLLAAESDEDTLSPVDRIPGADAPESSLPAVAEAVEPSEEIAEVDPPAPVDFTTADTETLQKAVEERDEYITYLLKRLRSGQGSATPAIDWEAISNAPDELQSRLKELEGQLEEKLRIAEVELSLERARLGREEAKLRHLNEQVQKNLKRLGSTPGDGGGARSDSFAGDDDRKERRWLRMLGLGNGEHEE